MLKFMQFLKWICTQFFGSAIRTLGRIAVFVVVGYGFWYLINIVWNAKLATLQKNISGNPVGVFGLPQSVLQSDSGLFSGTTSQALKNTQQIQLQSSTPSKILIPTFK